VAAIRSQPAVNDPVAASGDTTQATVATPGWSGRRTAAASLGELVRPSVVAQRLQVAELDRVRLGQSGVEPVDEGVRHQSAPVACPVPTVTEARRVRRAGLQRYRALERQP